MRGELERETADLLPMGFLDGPVSALRTFNTQVVKESTIATPPVAFGKTYLRVSI